MAKRQIEQWVFTTGSGYDNGEIFSLKGTRAQAGKFAKQILTEGELFVVRIYSYDFYRFELIGRVLRGVKNGKGVILVEWED